MVRAWLPAFALIPGLLATACGPGTAVAVAPSVELRVLSPTERLQRDLAAIFADPRFDRSFWSVVVRSPHSPADLYSLNASKLMMPGSAMKILTAAAAIEQLGWDYRFDTKIVSAAPSEGGTLRGDLIIIGSGDPSISERSDSPGQLQRLAAAVRQTGLSRIEGRVVGYDDAFDDSRFGDGWTLDNIPYGYSAAVSALEYNEGSVDLVVRAGAVPGEPVVIEVRPADSGLEVENLLITAPESAPGTLTLQRLPGSSRVVVRGRIPAKAPPFVRTASVDNPTQFFAAAFRSALVAEGIDVAGEAIDADDLPSKPDLSNATLLAVHRSPPLRDLIGPMLKVSQNQYAEMLLRAIGAAPDDDTGNGTSLAVGSAASGRQRVREILKRWDVAEDSYLMADGSGLSRYNFVSAEALARVLHVMATHGAYEPFREMLPVAGRDGTLARRLLGTLAEGKVRAKTGTVDNVRAIAGYVESADGETLIFSIMANNVNVPATLVDEAVDKAIIRMAAFPGGDVTRSRTAGGAVGGQAPEAPAPAPPNDSALRSGRTHGRGEIPR